MLDTKISFHAGEVIWLSNNAPLGMEKINAFWSSATGSFNSQVRLLKLENILLQNSGSQVKGQSSSIHARSVYLGQDLSGMHFFAKGAGWIQSESWSSKYPSIGILPKWAAMRERDVANYLLNRNIRCAQPVAIIQHLAIPSEATIDGYINSEEIRDLDGGGAEPSIYIYKSHSRWRLADLPFMDPDTLKELLPIESKLNNWILELLSEIASFTATLHGIGGHDYSLSLHNIFVDGTKVDFEYVYCPDLPHRVSALNEQIKEWQLKEIYALKCLAWEICELLKVNIETKFISKFIDQKYLSKLSGSS
jgi:hypothetical protein